MRSMGKKTKLINKEARPSHEESDMYVSYAQVDCMEKKCVLVLPEHAGGPHYGSC